MWVWVQVLRVWHGVMCLAHQTEKIGDRDMLLHLNKFRSKYILNANKVKK